MRTVSVKGGAPRWIFGLVLLLMIPAGALLFGMHGSPAPAVPAPARVAPAAGITHGDLVVDAANSPYILSPSTTGVTTYYEQGNITVKAGGYLQVLDLTLSFVQFISSSGTVGQRASHLYNFTDSGRVLLSQTILTTDVAVLNAYSKLTVSVSSGGTFSALSSDLFFPGWINVIGPSSSFFANNTTVDRNPSIPGLIENPTLRADSSFSPALTVTGGGRVGLFHSAWNHYYSDDFARNGYPGANVTDSARTVLSTGGSTVFNAFQVEPPIAASLALDLAYPTIGSAWLNLSYAAPATVTVGSASILFGQGFPITPFSLPIPAAGANTSFAVPLPASFVNYVNAQGLLSFLQATGQFGTANGIAVDLNNTAFGVGSLTINSAEIFLEPSYPFNMTAGAGSTITAADTTLDLNWAVPLGTPVSPGVPTPTLWGSNKLLLSGASHSFFANVSYPTGFDTVFDNQSSVIPQDAGSAAYFYRWALVHTSSPTYGAIPGATVTTFSSANGSQTNNATVTYLNNFAGADPDLAGYLVAWAAARGIPYGVTDLSGSVPVMLASTEVSSTSLPTGQFVGAYHVNTQVAGAGAAGSLWFYSSVTPYPDGMSPAGYDYFPVASYPNYEAKLQGSPISLAVDAVAISNSTVAIGQTLSVSIILSNIGNAATFQGFVSLAYQEPRPLSPLGLNSTTFGAIAPGAHRTITLNWTVNETIVGARGSVLVTFLLTYGWNGGVAPTGATNTSFVTVEVTPSFITVSLVPPSGALNIQQEYAAGGHIVYSGLGSALVNITLQGPGGPFLVGQRYVSPGTFTADLQVPSSATPGSKYTLVVTAYYNGRTGSATYPSAITIAGTPPAGPNFLQLTFFGIQLLWWIIIGAVIAAGAVGGLWALGRVSRSKLVECGECGNLIPESALACPRCGAEFEADLVRCSRCGSTIPAKSPICPECAATLIGSAASEKSDPERQGYADFVERFRADAKKELQENYGEGAFWDWWKRQPSYVSFSQWKSQQSAGSRAGMVAPSVTTVSAPGPLLPPRRPPSAGSAPAPRMAPPSSGPASSVPPGAGMPPETDTTAAPAAAAAPGPGMRACTSCGKEIPSDFLVCPFCGAVTR